MVVIFAIAILVNRAMYSLYIIRCSNSGRNAITIETGISREELIAYFP
jgi:hypothetical protein